MGRNPPSRVVYYRGRFFFFIPYAFRAALKFRTGVEIETRSGVSEIDAHVGTPRESIV